jgi:hypothetical protein
MISFGAHGFAEEQFCSRKRSQQKPLVVAASINSIFKRAWSSKSNRVVTSQQTC